MANPAFYDLSKQSVAQRESFNNTILLLSMVKSDNYYIIGFSRPKQQIEIGFDLDRYWHEPITQTLLLDFSKPENGISVEGIVAALPIEYCSGENISASSAFRAHNGEIIYSRHYPMDALLPHTVSKLDRVLQASKAEILNFLTESYTAYSERGSPGKQ